MNQIKQAINYHKTSIKQLQKQISNKELTHYLEFCAKEDIRARELRLEELNKFKNKTSKLL